MNLSNVQLTDDNLGDIIKRLKTLPRPLEHSTEILQNAETSKRFHNSATPIQDPSYMISQGCYGLSQNDPIGTEHVGNCIAIILRNPQSNLTSLVHFDAHTSPESLNDIFKAFKGQPIEASIIGGKYAEINDPKYKGYYQDTSRKNILAVLDMLATNNAKLTSAWIADLDQPHAFIVDPKSGQMQVGAPSIPDPEKNILFATRYLSDGSHDVALAYDLTESTKRSPMPLNPQTTKFLDQFGEARATKTKDELKEWMKSNAKNPDDLDFFSGMVDHYQKSQTASVSHVKANLGQTTTIAPTLN
jgi:hypothetical protein